MKNRVFLLMFCILACVYLSAQTSVVPLSTGAASPESVVYLLPKLDVVVEIEMEHTVRKAGPFYKYAERYLGVCDMIVGDDSEWRLAAVRLHSRIVPDTTKAFAVAVNKKTTAYNIQTDDKGVIRSVNQLIESPVTPFCPAKKQPLCDTLPPFSMACLGEEALVANSVPKMAEMAAKQIYRIRESRANLLSGENEILPDGTALQLMLNRLDKEENELLALFVGRTSVCHSVSQIEVSPVVEQTDSVLFRISRHEGLLPADDLSGEPVYFSLLPEPQGSLPAELDGRKPFGLFYNVPRMALVTISDGVDILAEKSFAMPQLGALRSLPAALFDGCATKVCFTRLGGIKSISK